MPDQIFFVPDNKKETQLQGVQKKVGLRISALYVFYCAMWAFIGLLNILGGSYIKIKYYHAILKAFNIFLPNFDPSKCSIKQ